MLRPACLLAALLVVTAPAQAWNAAGHMTTAAIAYRDLAPDVRAEVDALLAHHPEATRWDADRELHRSTLAQGEYRFLQASTWPDKIKRKRGWPNRANWHFANFPISGPASADADDPGARHDILIGLASSESALSNRHGDAAERAIALAYVIHLIGDLHQPLHCATAITASHPPPKGDEGGNETEILIDGKKRVKLHAFWDGMFGNSKSPDEANRKAALLEREIDPKTIHAGGRERDWCLESRRLAQSVGYPRDTWTTSGAPIAVDRVYIDAAKRAGERQMVVGGVRLAAVLANAMK